LPVLLPAKSRALLVGGGNDTGAGWLKQEVFLETPSRITPHLLLGCATLPGRLYLYPARQHNSAYNTSALNGETRRRRFFVCSPASANCYLFSAKRRPYAGGTQARSRSVWFELLGGKRHIAALVSPALLLARPLLFRIRHMTRILLCADASTAARCV